MRSSWKSSKFIDLALSAKVEEPPFEMLKEKSLPNINLLRFNCKTTAVLNTNIEIGTFPNRRINPKVTWVKALTNRTEITVTDHSWRKLDPRTAMKLCTCDQATTLKTSQRMSSISENKIRNNTKTNYLSRLMRLKCEKKLKKFGRCKKRSKRNKRLKIN